jgi:transposase
MRLKAEHGDLNAALIRLYVKVYGRTSDRQLAQDIGVSRSVIRRSLQKWSENNRPKY